MLSKHLGKDIHFSGFRYIFLRTIIHDIYILILLYEQLFLVGKRVDMFKVSK